MVKDCAYIDDLAVFLEGKIALNHVLEMIEAWMKNNLMEINYKKCGIFKLNSNYRETIPAKMVEKVFNRFLKVNSYKYLGLQLN